jgi:MFS family permease
VFTYTNQTEETITIKLNWNPDEKTLYNSLIGSFAVGAMCIGTPISGRLMKIGRLRVLDLAAIVGIIGSALTMILDIKALLAGRILYGFSLGLLVISWPRYMDEVLPPSQLSFYGGIYAFSIAFGTITAFLLALGLPPDDDHKELKADEFWRVIWGLPVPMYLI